MPPLADRFEQLVAASDDGAGLLVVHVGPGLLQAARHGPIQQVPGALVRPQQGLDVAPQSGVACASLIQVRGTLVSGRQSQGGGEDRLGAVGGVGHGSIPIRSAVSLRVTNEKRRGVALPIM